MILSIIFAVLSLVTCVLFCVFRAKKASNFSLALKSLASIFFVLSGLCVQIRYGYSTLATLVLIGLIFGLVGDVVLDLKVMYPKQSNTYFLLGTAAFAIGHMFYFVTTMLFNMMTTPNTLIVSLVVSLLVSIALTTGIMISSKKMNLNFGSNKIAVIAYSVVLTFMLCYSVAVAIFNPIYWIFAGGMLLFLLSDLVLSMQYFGGRDQKSLIFVNHITYYLAQIMFVVFLVVLMVV